MNNAQLLTQPASTSVAVKPVELYIFINPLCPTAVQMMTVIRKLHLQYGHYFSSRFVLSTELATLNTLSNKLKGCYSGMELDIAHPALPSIAIKAAELQGKRAGNRYLMKLQQYVALGSKNIHSHATLLQIAQEIGLDMTEFSADFGSTEAARAFQCDLYIRREMDVTEVPSIVFFNECIEDEGLKVEGLYEYHLYEHILQELMGEELIAQPLPTIDQLLQHYGALSSKELAEIYSLDVSVVEFELKKRMLQQKIERITSDCTTLWQYKTS